MSYSRFGSDSDVYMFRHVVGGITCCACRLTGNSIFTAKSEGFDTYDAAINHLKEHIAHGHKVDKHAISMLALDRDNGESLEGEENLFGEEEE